MYVVIQKRLEISSFTDEEFSTREMDEYYYILSSVPFENESEAMEIITEQVRIRSREFSKMDLVGCREDLKKMEQLLRDSFRIVPVDVEYGRLQ